MYTLEKPNAKDVTIVFVVALFVVLFFYLGQREEPPEITQPESAIGSREQLIRDTSAPPGAESILQGEERQQVLDSLSAPADAKPEFRDEERKKILESTSMPSK